MNTRVCLININSLLDTELFNNIYLNIFWFFGASQLSIVVGIDTFIFIYYDDVLDRF